jgi:hypothetical protein
VNEPCHKCRTIVEAPYLVQTAFGDRYFCYDCMRPLHHMVERMVASGQPDEKLRFDYNAGKAPLNVYLMAMMSTGDLPGTGLHFPRVVTCHSQQYANASCLAALVGAPANSDPRLALPPHTSIEVNSVPWVADDRCPADQLLTATRAPRPDEDFDDWEANCVVGRVRNLECY